MSTESTWAEVLSRTDYYPFGLEMTGRTESNGYRYGFNGKEKDNPGVGGGGSTYDYGFRIYNPTIGKFLSVDPLADKYPGWSPFTYTLNNPILYVDPDGRDAEVAIKGNTITVSSTIYIYGSGATQATTNLMQQNIMGAWSKDQNGNNWTYTDAASGNTYDVVFDIKVQQYDPSDPNSEPGLFSGKNNPFNTDNYVEVDNKSKRSFVRGGDEGVWRGQGRNGIPLAQDDSAPHEFGHIIGLPDEYNNGKGANPGWQGNIMAAPAMQGNVQQKNINQLLSPLVQEYNESLTKKTNDNLGTNIEYKTKIDP